MKLYNILLVYFFISIILTTTMAVVLKLSNKTGVEKTVLIAIFQIVIYTIITILKKRKMKSTLTLLK